MNKTTHRDEIEKFVDEFCETFYVVDKTPLYLLFAAVIGNIIPGPTVWLMLVGASSSGKTEFINLIEGVEKDGKRFVHPVSNLTQNTFLSGMSAGKKETSLLKRIGNHGILSMKDFTSIMSLNKDTLQRFVADMREIYDGALDRHVGTGKTLEWRGRLGLIAGATESLYQVEQQFSDMGSRWITYAMQPQDRKETTRVALRNAHLLKEKREYLQGRFSEIIKNIINDIDDIGEVPSSVMEDIIDISDISTLIRAAAIRNYRGEMQLSTSADMPMRTAKQCTQLYRAFMVIYGNSSSIPSFLADSIFKTAWYSTPKQRRIAMEALAKYQEVTTNGLAASIGYPTATVRTWLEDLAVRGVIKRKSGTGEFTNADRWALDDDARVTLVKFFKIETTTDILDVTTTLRSNEQSLEFLAAQQQQQPQNNHDQF